MQGLGLDVVAGTVGGCLVVERAGELIGHAVMSVAAGECHLLNLCVAPSWQRRGLGGILLEHVVRLALAHGCESIFLEVRPSNRDAIRLYQRSGFTVIGKRPGYYSNGDGREDAIVMRLKL